MTKRIEEIGSLSNVTMRFKLDVDTSLQDTLRRMVEIIGKEQGMSEFKRGDRVRTARGDGEYIAPHADDAAGHCVLLDTGGAYFFHSILRLLTDEEIAEQVSLESFDGERIPDIILRAFRLRDERDKGDV